VSGRWKLGGNWRVEGQVGRSFCTQIIEWLETRDCAIERTCCCVRQPDCKTCALSFPLLQVCSPQIVVRAAPVPSEQTAAKLRPNCSRTARTTVCGAHRTQCTEHRTQCTVQKTDCTVQSVQSTKHRAKSTVLSAPGYVSPGRPTASASASARRLFVFSGARNDFCAQPAAANEQPPRPVPLDRREADHWLSVQRLPSALQFSIFPALEHPPNGPMETRPWLQFATTEDSLLLPVVQLGRRARLFGPLTVCCLVATPAALLARD